MSTVVHKNQSLLDISVQQYGTIESVFDLAKQNDVSITDGVEVGADLKSERSELENTSIKKYYKKNLIKPASAEPNIEDIEQIKEGIGHWYIGRDFKVS